VVFPEGYVENPCGARVALSPEFIKVGVAAADAFNALPRTCEKVAPIKRPADENNDNERYRFIPLSVFFLNFTLFVRYKANLLKRPRRGTEEGTAKEALSSSDSDAPISRAGTTSCASRPLQCSSFCFVAIALAQEAAAAARARAEAAAPSLKKPSAFLAESSDDEAPVTKQAASAAKITAPALGGQATLFSFLQSKGK
jgi:hypothetical protein